MSSHPSLGANGSGARRRRVSFFRGAVLRKMGNWEGVGGRNRRVGGEDYDPNALYLIYDIFKE